MHAFELTDLLAGLPAQQIIWREFLRVPDLSMGVYRLAAGSRDPQQPHSEDEVYFVVSGRGAIRVAEEDRAVGAGSIVFVSAHVEHRFHTIEEELTILVFFAPAEHSRNVKSP
jgi:mannose-6-phosphate isomerase-like protein (cupin superfamily)